MFEDEDMPVNYELIASRQSKDPKLQSKLAQGVYIPTTISGINLVTYKAKVVIPDSLIMPLIRWYHEILNHPGKDRTYHTIEQYFFHRGLSFLTSKFVNNCSTCQKWKRPGRRYGKIPVHTTQYQPWECIQIDLFGKTALLDKLKQLPSLTSARGG